MCTVAAFVAMDALPRAKPSNYPPNFAVRMTGRVKRPLGDLFGLSNFGVNLSELEPGAISSLHHRHSRQDEFIYILGGEAVLVTGENEVVLLPGMCAGFKAGGAAHHLENRSGAPVLYIEIGDRTEGDEVSYPIDDLVAVREDGAWRFHRRDGTSY